MAPEEFQRRQHQALEGVQGVRSVGDDILVFGKGKAQAQAEAERDRERERERERERDLDRKVRALIERWRE